MVVIVVVERIQVTELVRKRIQQNRRKGKTKTNSSKLFSLPPNHQLSLKLHTNTYGRRHQFHTHCRSHLPRLRSRPDFPCQSIRRRIALSI
ncbi:hypothetical protein E2C01_087032 [Portunus trituberculatus]|uniref:Uncharacterized protein n=1 Tax=Portunus trituberculatus TaxID=210409 RepID=A0A5B7JBB1_PORTR|nr:hypothetical protein [Portunus trituberculatus]